MEEPAAMEEITIGGSPLSSATVYAVANSFVKVKLDHHALDKLLPSTTAKGVKVKNQRLGSFLSPSVQLSAEEYRASLLVLIAKLLTVSNIRKVIPQQICEALNSNTSQEQLGTLNLTGEETLTLENLKKQLGTLDLTNEETLTLEKLKESSALYGICVLLEHQSAALSTLSDAVAALSCEVLNADVTGFSSVDGYHWKEEENRVAHDLMILLKGSKLVGKVETNVETNAVSEILNIHAALRKQLKSVQAMTVVALNSGAKDKVGNSERITLSALSMVLFGLGSSCLRRRFDLALDKGKKQKKFKKHMQNLKTKHSINDVNLNNLKSVFQSVSELAFGRDDVKFANHIRILLNLVWKFLTWEAITAFVALVVKKDKRRLGQGSVVMAKLMPMVPMVEGDAINANVANVSVIVEGIVEVMSSILDPRSNYLKNIRLMVGEPKILLIEGHHHDMTYTINATVEECKKTRYYRGQMTMINAEPYRRKTTYDVSFIRFETLDKVELAFVSCQKVSHEYILRSWFYTYQKDLQCYLLCYENFDCFLEQKNPIPIWMIEPLFTDNNGQPNGQPNAIIQENIRGVTHALLRLHDNGVSHTHAHSGDQPYNYVLCGDRIKMINLDYLRNAECVDENKWHDVKEEHILEFGNFIAHLLRFNNLEWPEKNSFLDCLKKQRDTIFKRERRLLVSHTHPFLMDKVQNILQIISEAHHAYISKDDGRRLSQDICYALNQKALDKEFINRNSNGELIIRNSKGVPINGNSNRWRPTLMRIEFENIIKHLPAPTVATSQPSSTQMYGRGKPLVTPVAVVPQQSTLHVPDKCNIWTVVGLFKFLRNVYAHYMDHNLRDVEVYSEIRKHWPSFIAIVHELTT